MQKINLLLLLLLLAISTRAQRFEWAKRGGLWAYDYGQGIGTDPSGNVYVAGKYEMNAVFSGVTLPCQGNHDIFTAKYDPYGNLVWIRTAGGPSGDYAHALCTGSNGVYIAGEVEGSNTTIKFIGSPITLTAWGNNDVMVARYDFNGNLIWARRTGAYNNEKASGVAVDGSGNVYVCGYFENSTTFGSTSYSSYGLQDIFILKVDANGNLLWSRRAGSAGRDEPKGIKCDASGNVYVCGMYKNNCNFMGQNLLAPNGYMNAFLAKIDGAGNLTWVRTGGGNWDDVGWGVTIDNAGKVFMTGEFNADANFSGQHLYTTGMADVFVACYTADGALSWLRKGGGTRVDRARGIGTDGNNIFITGQFGGTASFGGYSCTAADESDIFMAAMNNSGTWLWANSAGGPADDPNETLGFESGIAICAEASGNVYATGSTMNGGSFGSTTLSPYTRTDVFVTKMKHGVAARENEEPPLAKEELFFNSKLLDKSVALTWNYVSEDKKDIVLEKSFDGEHFATVQRFYASEIAKKDFSVLDVKPDAQREVHYRLRLIDIGGGTSFSRVLSVKPESDPAAAVDIFPNPARTSLSVNLQPEMSGKNLQLSVIDMEGRQIWQQELKEACKLDVSPWSKGMYVVIIRNDEAVLSRQKILVE